MDALIDKNRNEWLAYAEVHMESAKSAVAQMRILESRGVSVKDKSHYAELQGAIRAVYECLGMVLQYCEEYKPEVKGGQVVASMPI